MSGELPEDIKDFIEELLKLGCDVVVKEVSGELVLEVPEKEKVQ